MTKSKKQNPIEEAIGARAKPKTEELKTGYTAETFPRNPSKTQEEPSPSEMLTLEELNRQTEERLQEYPEEEIPQEPTTKIVTPKSEIPVSKPDPQPATENSSLGSPPQKIEEIDEYEDAEKREALPLEFTAMKNAPAEDIHLKALRDYIMDTGFTAAGVAFHIVALCSQPMTTPTTTTWDFKERASIPEMVFALLKQPGYIEGIWPSLQVVMADNKGNAVWTAGIATTIAFFDVIRTLPALKELSNENRI